MLSAGPVGHSVVYRKEASTGPAAAQGPSVHVRDLPQGVWTKHS